MFRVCDYTANSCRKEERTMTVGSLICLILAVVFAVNNLWPLALLFGVGAVLLNTDEEGSGKK